MPSFFIRRNVVIICSIALFSCSNKAENELIKSMEESLLKQTFQNAANTNYTYYHLKEKSENPASSEKASIWLPKADSIILFTEKTVKKISNQINDTDTSPNEINNLLKNYFLNISKVDNRMWQEFEEGINKSQLSTDSLLQSSYQKRKKETTATIIANIRVLENKMIAYCNEQVSDYLLHDSFHEYFSPIVCINKSVFQPGETLEIQAGMGNYSIKNNPEIIINGKKQVLNESAYTNFKSRANNKPGKYKVSVVINGIDEDRKPIQFTQTIEYTVTKPCQ